MCFDALWYTFNIKYFLSSRLVLGSNKMDTYVEPEIEEVQGPMDEDDIMMDVCGYQEDLSSRGSL